MPLNPLQKRYLYTALAGGIAGGAIGGYTTKRNKNDKEDDRRNYRERMFDRVVNGALLGSTAATVGRMAYDLTPISKGSGYRRGFYKVIDELSPKESRKQVFEFFSSPKNKVRNLLAQERDRSLSNRARYDALVSALPEDLRSKAPAYDGTKMYSPRLPYGQSLSNDEILGLLNTKATWDTKSKIYEYIMARRSYALPYTTTKGNLHPDSGAIALFNRKTNLKKFPFTAIHEKSHHSTAPVQARNDTGIGVFDLPFWVGAGDNARPARDGSSGYYIGPAEGIGAALRTKAVFQEVFGRIPRSYNEWKEMSDKLFDPEFFKKLPKEQQDKILFDNMGIKNLWQYDKDIMNEGFEIRMNAWRDYIDAMFQQARNTPKYSYGVGTDTKVASANQETTSSFCEKLKAGLSRIGVSV